MRINNRVHKDYLSCELPELAPFPVSPANRGAVINGCVPFTNEGDPNRDPDLPPTVVPGLYTHPRLPGVLLAAVSSSAELFRRGSSFVIGSTQLGQPMFGLVGASAEKVLLGEEVEFPMTLPSIINHRSCVRKLSEAEKDATIAKWREAFPSALSLGATYSGPWGTLDNAALGIGTGASAPGPVLATSPKTIPLVLSPHVQGGLIGLAYGRDERFKFSNYPTDPVTADTQIVVMSVVTFADDGFIGTTNSVGDVHAQFEEHYRVTTVSSLARGHYPQWLSEVPSDLREFAPSAFAAELARVEAHKKNDVRLKVVTSLVYKATGVYDVVAGHGCWYPQQSGSTSSCTAAPSLTNTAYPMVGVRSKHVSVLEARKAASRALLANCSIRGGVFQPRAWPIVQYESTKPVDNLGEVVIAAATIRDVFSPSAITTAANAAGWNAFAGTAQQVRVPSTKASLELPMAVGQMCSTVFSGNAAIMLRELFRRTYARMEQQVRSS